MRSERPTKQATERPVARHRFLPRALLLLSLAAVPALAQHGGGNRRGMGGQVGGPPRFNAHPNGGMGRPRGGQHLPEWFAQHQQQSPAEQENALRHEPGFTRLPPGQQQQLVDRLHRLDMESPQQRQRLAQWNERFMALPPERQQEIRGASQALSRMSPDRRQAVRQAFHDLRQMPTQDREQALDSARFQAEYSPQERTIMRNLLSIEPSGPQPAAPEPPR